MDTLFDGPVYPHRAWLYAGHRVVVRFVSTRPSSAGAFFYCARTDAANDPLQFDPQAASRNTKTMAGEMHQIKERHMFRDRQAALDFESFLMRRFPFEAYKTRCDLVTQPDGKTELQVSRWCSCD